jgi:hypothetical protein
MNKIHDKQGKRIQNGKPFDYMLDVIAKDKNKGILSDKISITDVSRHAIVHYWRHLGYKQIPVGALSMLKERIEDIDL